MNTASEYEISFFGATMVAPLVTGSRIFNAKVTTMEAFIESSARLLEAYPSSTVSITYANVLKKSKKTDEKRATNVVKFKVYHPNSTKCIKYHTYKAKEVSKILTYLGPRGVSDKRTGDVDESPKTTLGVASAMSNVKFEEEEPPKAVEKEATPAEEVPVATTSRKKKKKGKK